MILRKLILLAAGGAALVVSAGVTVVALIFALHAVMEPHIGKAGATAVVVALFAAVLGGGAAIAAILGRAKKVQPAPPPTNRLVDRLSEIVRERPVVALSAAVGAGVLAIRNPRYLASALRSLATRPPAQA